MSTLHDRMYVLVVENNLNEDVEAAQAMQDVFHYLNVVDQCRTYVEFLEMCKANPKQASLARKLTVSQHPENKYLVYTVGKGPEWLMSLPPEVRESCKMTPKEFLELNGFL